jgi:hypothetical protein
MMDEQKKKRPVPNLTQMSISEARANFTKLAETLEGSDVVAVTRYGKVKLAVMNWYSYLDLLDGK